MSEGRTAVILCEDLLSSVVLRRLIAKKWGKRFPRVRILPLPAGRGCGSQYVRARYPDEVRAQRTSHVSQVLVVHMDGDDVGLQGRTNALAARLADEGHPARAKDEPIAHVIPCWQLETWVAHANGEAVTEDQPVPHAFRGREGKAAEPLVEMLARLTSGAAVAPDHLPALDAATAELRRL